MFFNSKFVNLNHIIYKDCYERRINLEVKGKKIGFVLTGSFCTFSKTIPKIKELKNLGAELIPIMSYNSYELDTKFGKASKFIEEIKEICNKEIIHTIQDAEPIRT